MKLIIFFKKGEYSPIKDKFKAIFAGKYKWDGKQAWVNKKGFVKATQKMESGFPVKFIVECDIELKNKFFEFCNVYKIEISEVESFDNVNVIEAKIEKPKPAFDVKLNKTKYFEIEYAVKGNITAKFFQGWIKLLREDDEKLNKKLEELNDNNTGDDTGKVL